MLKLYHVHCILSGNILAQDRYPKIRVFQGSKGRVTNCINNNIVNARIWQYMCPLDSNNMDVIKITGCHNYDAHMN